MIVLRDRKLVYISTPKAGTHTLYAIFKELGGERQPGGYHRKHLLPECKADGWRILTTVRSPYTRAISAWWQLTGREVYRDLWPAALGGSDFDTFCDYLVSDRPLELSSYHVCIPQHEWLADVDVWRAMRIEEIDAELQALDLWHTPVPVMYHEPYEPPLLTPARRRKIEQWAGDDFERYGYDKVTP